MKKIISLCMCVLILFSLGACSNPTTPVTFSIPDDVTEASVTHVLSGQVSELSISGNDLLLLKEWVSGLQCEQEDFEQGNTPGDTEGGEAYSFTFDGKPDLDFSYVINGENDCYLIFGSTWYSVSNPVDPPLSNSISKAQTEISDDLIDNIPVEIDQSILKICEEYAQSLGYEIGTFQKAVLLGDKWLSAVFCDDDMKAELIDKKDVVVIFENIRCVIDAEKEIVLGRIPYV